MSVSATKPIEIGLHATVVAVEKNRPLVLIVPGTRPDEENLAGLPFGPFDPLKHRTLETGMRTWVEEQTHLRLGYVEQLYTFGDLDRQRDGARGDFHFVSVGYLALVRRTGSEASAYEALPWNSWYHHFPWEDWRSGCPALLEDHLLPILANWAKESEEPRSGTAGHNRLARVRRAFGCDFSSKGTPVIENWDEERVLDRYELMYEAGLVDEAIRDGHAQKKNSNVATGIPMLHDHRRILATAMARLRAKLKYRPVVFELLPESFTLTELQQTVETLSGRLIHKQNFRRMVEKADLVEPTGATTSQTGGRPAAYFRFRREVMNERPAPGLRISSRG